MDNARTRTVTVAFLAFAGLGLTFGLETMAAAFVVMSVIVFGFRELTILKRAKTPIGASEAMVGS